MRPPGQRGSATLLVLAMASVLLLVGAAVGVVTAMVRAHRVAQSAADLTALAAAQTLQVGGDPCARAAEIAVANGARLTSCAADARLVTVRVTVDGPHWLGQEADLTAEARAGPAALTFEPDVPLTERHLSGVEPPRGVRRAGRSPPACPAGCSGCRTSETARTTGSRRGTRRRRWCRGWRRAMPRQQRTRAH
jgi:secretion/DNA translocation related TadE-like protein